MWSGSLLLLLLLLLSSLVPFIYGEGTTPNANQAPQSVDQALDVFARLAVTPLVAIICSIINLATIIVLFKALQEARRIPDLMDKYRLSMHWLSRTAIRHSIGPNAKKMAVRKIATKGNKPGEPPFKLELDTKDVLNIRWEKSQGSTFTDIKMTNPFDDFHTFKVKCTDNNIFRVRPPMGAIDPKTTFTIRVIQHAQERPANNKHFVALLHMKCTAADAKKNNWRMVWRPDTKPEGIIRIPIAFVDAPTTPGPSVTPSGPTPTAEATAAPSTVTPTAKP